MIKRIKENRLLLILGILIIVVTITLITRIAYAFMADVFQENSKSATIVGSSTNKMTFDPGEPLTLSVTSENLQAGENRVSPYVTSRPSINLIANNVTNEATLPYYMYLKLDNSGFQYTSSNQAEVVLTIQKPNGDFLSNLNIEGLTYGTWNGVEGYDITQYSGIIPIARGEAITSNIISEPGKTDTWELRITYVNLVNNQNANVGQTITSALLMSQEEKTDAEIEALITANKANNANATSQ